MEAKLSSRGSTPVASIRQCTNSDRDNAAPCLLKRLGTPYLLRRLAIHCLMRRLVAPYLLRGLAILYFMRRLAAPYLLGGLPTSYLLRRLHSLVIVSGPEVLGSFGSDSTGGVGAHPEDTELETLIATYDIPLDLRPRLSDPNFRMINLLARDTAMGIYSRIFDSSGVRIPFSSFLLVVLKYLRCTSPGWFLQTLSKQGDWFSFTKRGDPAPEPHGLDTSILGRVADRTTSPAPAGAAIPCASLEEVSVTQPDRFSGQADIDEVEQTDDGTLDDDDQHDGLEFVMEITKPNLMLSCLGCEEGYQGQFLRISCKDVSPRDHEAGPALDAQSLDADADVDGFASDGNVDPYYEARVSNTTRDVLERDLLPIVPGPYYISYPYDESTRKLYKDPKVCRTALNRFPTPAETHRLRELSLVEFFDRMSEVSRLTDHLRVLKSRCQTTEQKHSGWDKKHKKYKNERDALAIEKAKIKEELVETKLQLEHHEMQAKGIQGSIASFFQSDFTLLVRRFFKSGEFIRVFAGVLNTAIIVGVECGLSMDCIDKEFRELSQQMLRLIHSLPVSADVASGFGLLNRYGPALLE
uniref:Transposase (Putative), gypsy type n=1 Tax=Tanacetum cinerariifolium TaxID=118510 RepID=A0A6L2NL57_TANCI|nr:hypothetical protein [Tanacetum cinerariifolium]